MAFDLTSLRKGKQGGPPRMLIYGEHGMGKSTFASQAPSPVFVPTEDGLGAIDTTAFPLAKKYQDVLDAIAALYNEDHDHHAVVVDSLDWLEDMIWKHVAEEGGHDNIEDFGYGKGYVYAADRFREVLSGLNALRDKKGMAVILTAHSQIKRFDDPASEPYDRYMLKLHSKAAGIVQEWSDIVGFVAQEMIVKKEDVGFNKKVARGVSTGGHALHLARTPAFDAKNRFGLPDTLPLNWDAFAEALTEANQTTQP
jgi:hypothetical protein